MSTSAPHRSEPIAIVGSACRFPGNSSSPSKLWDLLHQPRDVLSRIPDDRFNPAGHYHPDGLHHGTTNVQDSYFLHDNIRHFDTQFFGIKAVEARTMDPQQRMLLEVVYEGLENAGMPIEDLGGSNAGVFVGLMCADWEAHLRRNADKIPVYTATGTARSILSNRISYFFNWHGPSMTIDTACSSSLVAVHLAIQSLRSGETPIAIAAGANLIVTPDLYVAESKLKMLSPGSRSRMWDVDADGYARGEGVAALILKPLSAAIRDGDTIESVILETAINQDGRTLQGITMPSAKAQAELIRTTYAKAGLDPSNESMRCQYFEAHGTGTPAGDPQEAEAIAEAFFGTSHNRASAQHPLYVGSIKTVIGHTEGTAGIAGLMKASLAVQHGVIAPNLLFNKLNPALAPFYTHLEVPTQPVQWPVLSPDQKRRASVNSFGFGGTNAHAIIEQYTPATPSSNAAEKAFFRPFVFSAASQNTLVALLKDYATFLEANNDVSLRDLSYTLHSRRSVLPYKTAFTADSVTSLVTSINAKLASASKDNEIGLRIQNKSSVKILGVFTGQGAQWTSMGRELILNIPSFRKCLERLDGALAALPSSDRPAWSITAQLLQQDDESARLSEAALSQPVCTAVQIALVDILRECGVSFKAVVGHSSGEIGAAYAAGFIGAEDAIRIAYYRGVYARLAGKGTPGAMMAVGTSHEDAMELCDFPEFQGRISVAACNSSSSITLSGDADAIDEAKFVLDDEKKFARMLKVDTAYHSRHMEACSMPYLEALHACNIQVLPGNRDCIWYSSVNEGERMKAGDQLKASYWNDNMLKPVLFAQAISAAVCEAGNMDFAIEVGPHPALQGPALQTIQDIIGESIPYSSLLKRGSNDLDAFVAGLSFAWLHGGKGLVNLSSLDHLIEGSIGEPAHLLSNLPSYPWDHSRPYWFETRLSKNLMARSEACHDLLGNRQKDVAEEYRWKNNLRIRDIPWVTGHQLQGQTVLPAAAYVVTALEGALVIADGRPIKLIEIQDMTIGRALALDEGDEFGVETLFIINTSSEEIIARNEIVGDFKYSSASNDESDVLALNASGRLRIVLGDPEPTSLPQRGVSAPNMVDLDEDLFYSNLADIGYQYDGPFRALSSLSRAHGHGQGVVCSTPAEDDKTPLLVHPAMLDAAIQSILLAFCWPGDGSLRELHVPVGIRRIRINPFFNLSGTVSAPARLFPFDSVMSERTVSGFDGDVDIFAENSLNAAIQLEGLTVKPFAPSTIANDRHIFSTWKWDVMNPNCELAVGESRATDHDKLVASITEQACVYYLKELKATITAEEWKEGQWHHKKLLHFANHVLDGVANGTQPFSKRSWLDTTREELYNNLIPQIGDCVEMRLVRTVGEHLADAVRGRTNILEHMLEGDLLNDFYIEGRGVYEHTDFLASTVDQLVHSHGNMNILEIGAGTGGATKKIFKKIGHTFNSYTFTDISTGFFEKATQVFAAHNSKMIFRALDCEKDIEPQGYTAHSYDLIVASLVLHATEHLETTLQNVRNLLKPGGWLVMLELTPSGPMRLGFCMSGLSGWWLGWKDGRDLSPCATPARWHDALQKSGFSGVDAITPEDDVFERPCFVIAAQAVDERVSYLRHPLQSSIPAHPQEVVILGGLNLPTIHLADSVTRLLRSCSIKTTRITTVNTASLDTLPSNSVILSLVDLDEPIFKTINEDKLAGLKQLLDKSKVLLWITRGRIAKDPYMNMVLGFAATLRLEMPLLRTQFLELDQAKTPDAQLITESVLSLNGYYQFESTAAKEPLLWSSEPEIMEKNGTLIIPRLQHIQAANERHNSVKRAINVDVAPSAQSVDLAWSGDHYSLREVSQLARHMVNAKDTISVRVSYSSLAAVRTSPFTHHFVVFGKNVASGEDVIGLSPENSSIVHLPRQHTVAVTVDPSHLAALIQSTTHELLATYISSQNSGGLLVHEPDTEFASLLQKHADMHGLKVTFSTTRSAERPSTWLAIHPQSTRRLLQSSLPRNITCFINWESEYTEIGHMIEDCLPSLFQHLHLDDLLPRSSTVRAECDDDSINKLLRTVVSSRVEALLILQVSEISLAEMADGSTKPSRLSVVNWTTSDSVSVKVQPLDSSNIFMGDKTYILFGLTSDLAQSLCMWMVAHGARYIVLTSRNPKISQEWLRRVKAMGATIKVIANDITSEKAVQELCDDIFSTMPPIAGIANGAMVLVDTMITEMTEESWNRVIKPKVNGSIYLERIFADKKLDFFIFFSSIAAVYGNEGQSNYGAANMYMTSLAYQRRQRGQAASVVHIGPITGAGYVTREAGVNVLSWVVNHGHCLLSQNDFFTGFAEAMLAGRPELGLSPEIVLDERFQPGKDMSGEDPRFQFTLPRAESEERFGSTAVATSVRVGLVDAATAQEVLDIVKSGFFAKLQILLQDDPDDVDTEELLDRAANELGIDSLIAVDLRAWFLKELEVDMPVLKILGGASIRDMLDYSIEKLPRTLIPKVSGDLTDLKAPVEEVPAVAVDSVGMDQVVQIGECDLGSSSSSSAFSILENEESPEGVFEGSGFSSPASLSEVDVKPNHESPSISRTLELSFGQSRFWTLMSLLEDSTALNIACLVRLTGTLRVNDLDRAVRAVGERHEALRTCFVTDQSGTAMQSVAECSTLSLEQTLLSETEVLQEFKQMRHYQFDIARGEVMRVLLASQSAVAHFLIISYHHIAMDGVSLEIFLSDLQKSYNQQPLSTSVLQYPDFSERQRRQIRSGEASSDLAFWKHQFPIVPAPLPLLPFSTTSSRRVLAHYDFNSIAFRVDGSLTTRIKLACKKYKTTPFHFYFAAYQALLYRLLKVENFCIGMADANRLDSDVQNSIGNYLNLLPVRVENRPSLIFAEAMQQIRTQSYAALGHSKVPFDVLLEELHVERSVLHSPLFQALINYRQGVQEKRIFGDAKAEAQDYIIAKTAYDFTIDIVDNPGGHALISFMVQKSLYSDADAKMLMDCFVRLLEGFSKKPTALLSAPSLYDPEETEKALALGRGPSTAFSGTTDTLVHRIDDVVQAHPENVALKDSTGRQLTYRQMEEHVNTIASALISEKLGGDVRVAVFQEPTIDWVCSMLAIMRIGATYVPLDPRLSVARLRVVVQECRLVGVLVNETTASEVHKLELGTSVIVNVSCIDLRPTHTIKNVAHPNKAAVVLYTSGSTGVPKGITLRHVGLANEISDSADKFSLGANDKVLQQSALSFDMSLWQTFNALTNGGLLFIVAKEHRMDPSIIAKHMATEQISVTCATPSEYLCWLLDGSADDLKASKWKIAIAGGEQVTRTHLDAFAGLQKPGLRFFNGYGPSEVSIVSNKIELPYNADSETQSDASGRFPVGYTTKNCSVYILDEEKQLMPVGYMGEIFIGGPGVAMEYLGDSKLTQKNFFPDMSASPEQASKGFVKMYKTGDRGRLRADGALIVEGRIAGDTEVKLRGIRIDLQDVEKAIIKTGNGVVLDAVVSVNGEPEYLAAHLVFSPSVSAEQRDGLWMKVVTALPLPKYMRPAVAVAVHAFPLTEHGKVDRQAIAKILIDGMALNSSTDDNTEVMGNQSTLRNLWSKLLPTTPIETIKPSSDFFLVGGNSGILVRLQRLIRDSFSVVIPLMQIFESSTLESMTALIESFGSQGNIDWDIETAIDGNAVLEQVGKLMQGQSQKKKSKKALSILLTGASGNIGVAVLRNLVKDPRVGRVHCVALRGSEADLIAKLDAAANSAGKLTIHHGDLTSSQLGLSAQTFAALAAEVDSIVHCGAARSFWDYYHTLRDVNVGSVREIITLATAAQTLGSKTSIHFLSSGGVQRLSEQPSIDGREGYVSSKWAAEKLLQNAASKLGLQVIIHRIGSGPSSAPTPDIVEAETTLKSMVLQDFVKYSRVLHALPEDANAQSWSGVLGFLPLGDMARKIASTALIISPSSSTKNEVKVNQYPAHVRLSTQEISAHVQDKLAESKEVDNFERIAAIEWVGRAKKVGWEWVFADLDLVKRDESRNEEDILVLRR